MNDTGGCLEVHRMDFGLRPPLLNILHQPRYCTGDKEGCTEVHCCHWQRCVALRTAVCQAYLYLFLDSFSCKKIRFTVIAYEL